MFMRVHIFRSLDMFPQLYTPLHTHITLVCGWSTSALVDDVISRLDLRWPFRLTVHGLTVCRLQLNMVKAEFVYYAYGTVCPQLLPSHRRCRLSIGNWKRSSFRAPIPTIDRFYTFTADYVAFSCSCIVTFKFCGTICLINAVRFHVTSLWYTPYSEVEWLYTNYDMVAIFTHFSSVWCTKCRGNPSIDTKDAIEIVNCVIRKPIKSQLSVISS